jgi:hypothetical protein
MRPLRWLDPCFRSLAKLAVHTGEVPHCLYQWALLAVQGPASSMCVRALAQPQSS